MPPVTKPSEHWKRYDHEKRHEIKQPKLKAPKAGSTDDDDDDDESSVRSLPRLRGR